MPIFVSAVKGHLASRYGTATRTTNPRQIGATKNAKTREITWDESLVEMIPDAEHARFRREYTTMISEGALKVRTKADYDNWLAKHLAPSLEADAKAKGAREAVAIEASATDGAPAAA